MNECLNAAAQKFSFLSSLCMGKFHRDIESLQVILLLTVVELYQGEFTVSVPNCVTCFAGFLVR